VDGPGPLCIDSSGLAVKSHPTAIGPRNFMVAAKLWRGGRSWRQIARNHIFPCTTASRVPSATGLQITAVNPHWTHCGGTGALCHSLEPLNK